MALLVRTAEPVQVDEVVNTIRYDEMMKDFYLSVIGEIKYL